MAEQASKEPQDIRVTTLGGLNERVSPANLRQGEFSVLDGMYPSQVGLQSRIPGKVALATLPGFTNILQIRQTFNRNGDILVQSDLGRIAYTLDELQGRTPTAPNLTPGTTPGTNVEEESMSIAIMYQEESNGQSGGSAAGFLTGTDASSLGNTLYGRRLTANPVNQSSTLVSFTASTGGGGSVSTPGQFVLAPGTYRITGWFVYSSSSVALSATIGLYNITLSQFQTDDGTGSTSPKSIIASVQQIAPTNNYNFICSLNGRFVVSTSNNTFQINHAVASTTAGNGNTIARDKNLCGLALTPVTLAQFGGAAPLERYAMVQILKEP